MDRKRIIIYTILFVILVAIASQGFNYFDQRGLFYTMLAIMGFFTIIFLIAQAVTDNSIVDMVWGLAFVVGAWTTLLITDNPSILSYILVGFISVWGLRLSIRLIRRNLGEHSPT